METAVHIGNLNHTYGEKALCRQVLFDINFNLSHGEIVILTGASGSGKTTLLSLIGGLRSVQSGRLLSVGKELLGASEQQLIKVRRRIGYIFQGHNLLPFLTAKQNVQMALEFYEKVPAARAGDRAEAILETVGLSEHVNYYPQQLSGGQKQRVAIARALVHHPKLILADEPTAALDNKTGHSVVALMNRLAKEEGTAILMVTHDQRIFDMADRIIQMEDGNLKDCVVKK